MRREFGEGGVDPPLQRIAAEILLHDHVGVAAHVEPGEPGFEKLVQRVCAWFRARDVTDIEPYRLVDEDVEFRLPVELRRELALAETQS